MTKFKEKQVVNYIHLQSTEAFNNFLNMVPDVNKIYHRGTPLLEFLVDLNKLALVELLLNYQPKYPSFQKYNVNIKDKYNSAALTTAVYRENKEMVALLIKHGADVNTKDHWGYTPLHLAARYENTYIAKLLLENGANPNAVWKQDLQNDNENITPLHQASIQRNLDMVRLLVSYGANPELMMIDTYTRQSYTAEQIYTSDSHQNPDHKAEYFRKAVEDGLALRVKLSLTHNKRALLAPSAENDKRQKVITREENGKPDLSLTRKPYSYVEKLIAKSAFTETKFYNTK